jgi:biopolymer transport protein ExbD
MAKRELQEINAGSMADIAFLLLIFFLVTTTMDTDTGLTRRLPPMPPPNEKPQDNLIKKRNVFVVLVNKENQLLVANKLMNIKDLKEAAKEFIANPKNDPELPSKTEEDIPYFGKVMVTKNHVISLQTDRGTSYGMYIAVQNQLVKAYDELRDGLAMERFGKKFKNLGQPEQDAIEKIYPLKISEAEPKNVGGTK